MSLRHIAALMSRALVRVWNARNSTHAIIIVCRLLVSLSPPPAPPPPHHDTAIQCYPGLTDGVDTRRLSLVRACPPVCRGPSWYIRQSGHVPTSSHNANKISTRCASLLAISQFISLYMRASPPRSASVSAAVSAVCLYCLHGCIANMIVRRSHTQPARLCIRWTVKSTTRHVTTKLPIWLTKNLCSTLFVYCTWQRQPAIGKFCLAFCSERIQASSLYRFRMLYNFSCKESPEFGNFRLRVSIIWSMNIVCIS